ncbi:MAG: rhomboid family intramembrane serine protease [Planctomycetota bacterium]
MFFLRGTSRDVGRAAQEHRPDRNTEVLRRAYVVAGVEVELDTCRTCQLVWFDGGELRTLRSAAGLPEEKPLRPEAQAAVQKATVAWVKEDMRRFREKHAADVPEEPHKALLLLLGLPVETDGPELRTVPWLTWSLVALVTLTSILAFQDMETALQDWALLPEEFWRHGGDNTLTSFFVHGGWAHLIGNMYFLLIFGDNVECKLGRARYALLLVSATLAGAILHSALDPRPDLPSIGASDGISGVLVFYAMAFPHARIGLLVRYHYLNLKAIHALLLWVMLQFWYAYLQMEGLISVSALAHIGGAAAGVVTWWFWQRSQGPAVAATG